jgi:hypothetical protein
MFYTVQATLSVKTPQGVVVKQVPTFYLTEVVDCKHAERMAAYVCNPTDDPNITVNAWAVRYFPIVP